MMQIKNIENFNLKDCENYLNNHPDSEWVDAVKSRQAQLRDEIFRINKREDEERKRRVLSYEAKMRWMDMAQFNEKKKYKNLSVFRAAIIGVFLICAFMIGSVTYYSNTQHFIYDKVDSEQANHVTGFENLLLKCDMIETRYYSYDFTPRWDTYRADDAVGFPIFIGIAMVLILLLSTPFHSPMVNRIYNIQEGDMSLKYRVTQDRKGKMGLCKLGKFRLKRILPFEYQQIVMIPHNSYICKQDGKVGIYNTEIKKMTVPVMYDDIYAITDDSIDLLKDNQVYHFTHKGYRIVK